MGMSLVPWVSRPLLFFKRIQAPLIASERWWRTKSVKDYAHDESEGDKPAGASACSGVWNAGPDHPCHEAVRANNTSVTFDGVPVTRIYGVGPMKAGSTLVWQVLGAATQLSMGLDCQSSADTPLPVQVAR